MSARGLGLLATAVLSAAILTVPANAQSPVPSTEPGLPSFAVPVLTDAAWCDAYWQTTDPDVCLADIVDLLGYLEDGIPESVAAYLVTGINPTEVDIASPTSEAPQAEKPVTQKGKGPKGTKAFELQGGDYEVRMKIRGSAGSDYNCADDGLVTAYLIASGEDFGESVSQTGYVYGVEPGRYHWDVNTVDWCSWTITIAPA